MLQSHEHVLALIAMLVAGVASVIPLTLAIRGWRSGSGKSLRHWITAGALSIATATFALQFVGMLAFDVPLQTSYNVPVTLLSLLIAIIVCGFALHTQASELAAANALLRESEGRYRQLVDLSPDAICIETAGCLAFVNGAFIRLLGAGQAQDLIGRPLVDLLESGSRHEAAERLQGLLQQGSGVPLQEQLERLDGSVVDVEVIAAPLVHGGRPSAQLVVRDITERRKAEERLAFLAQYDSLTGLPNRALLHDRIDSAMARAKRQRLTMSVMGVDLDHFKEINDTLGHKAGDRVLQEVAAIVRRTLRASDTVARQGGDEFTVIAENLQRADDAKVIAEKIQRALAEPVMINGHEIFFGASIGIALYPGCGEDTDALLQAADVAMYRAKEEGRNTCAFYAAEMNAHAAGRLRMESLLRRALERDEFSLCYQPKVAIGSGRITGVEALIRWNSPELGFVSPAQFIPLAEKTGLIVPIGEWVLRTACAQNRRWQDQGYSPVQISVNLSARQFRQKDLVAVVARALCEAGLAPRHLELEITESMIMGNATESIGLLNDLHALGVELSVDDFGTGYSSLAYLKRFPVQKLKVDRSFVRDATSSADDRTIVAAVIALAKNLGLQAIAEGVETKEQLELLAALGCDEYQGYYFSKPVPAAEITALFEKREQADRSRRAA